jgi:hypothetical protein
VPRPSSPIRRAVTEVKEFTFASDARLRRSPAKTQVAPSQRNKGKASQNDKTARYELVNEISDETTLETENDLGDVDSGLAMRMRAREMGAASILAWAETRGRYVE